MAEFRIEYLPKTADETIFEQQVKLLKDARLRSLKLDPAAFISKYEVEAEKPLSFFIERASPYWVNHFAVLKPDEENVYHGFAAVVNLTDRAKEQEMSLSPSHFNTVDYNIDDLVVYNLGALWIDPAARGQGLGSKLVEACLDFIRRDAARYKGKRALAYLSAVAGNHRVIKLYQRLGFRIFDNKSETAVKWQSVELARYVT